MLKNKLKTTDNFHKIVIDNIPLIDVRAPIEYEKGAFPNSVNLPILTNEERHIIGICYKNKGNEAATKLGYELVSGKVKEDRLSSWLSFIDNNKNAMIYCFRGGSRSTIAQQWITEAQDREIIKLDGGYKAFRNYLISSFLPEEQNYKPLILAGYTGSGKTILLNKLNNSIDLEGIANHRGSSFGAHIKPQPTQINFENTLAYKLINHKHNNYKHLVIEDEGRNVGKNFIPEQLTAFFSTGDLIVLDVPIEDRIANTLQEYVIDSQKEYLNHYGEVGLDYWYQYIYNSMERVKRKLGGDRFNDILNEFSKAYTTQLKDKTYIAHHKWIEMFLKYYYDPMYKHGIEKNKKKILYKGNFSEVLDFLKNLE